MQRIFIIKRISVFIVFFLTFSAFTLIAQEGPPAHIKKAVHGVEEMINSEGDQPLENFINKYMDAKASRDQEELLERLRDIRNQTKSLTDNIIVEAEPEGISLLLSANGQSKKLLIKVDEKGISDLFLGKSAKPIVLTRNNLVAAFDSLEAEGMAGLVYIKRNDEVLLKRAFGMANKSLKIPNTTQTIFAIGSRPIDFTIAAIYLLDQQNKINVDDKIEKYFENVPPDKQAITILHLLTGQSGLPDFFHTEEDWDPDLAWVTREVAEKRLLSQKLLFSPGEGRQHSHGAFVLLAALTERVSGEPYYSFIRKYFLDPAGMKRTGEYGETRSLSIDDFATGDGPQFVGLPNIPPNWGPTSWLIKGSGGMYSTLEDLQKFYSYVRSGKVLDDHHNVVFRQSAVNLDGSDRGFELFSVYNPPGNEVYLFINSKIDGEKMHQVFRALEIFAGEKNF
jgi:hypothetical protein